MKIAKKVLAVAMAVAMIACFAAIAFAAPADAAYKVSLVDATDDGYDYALVLSIENGVSFAAGGVTIKYDPAVLVYAEDNAEGKDAAAMKKLIKSSNSFTYEANGDTAGELVAEFYFKENLWSTEKFLAEKKASSKDADVKAINVNAFELINFYFTLAEGKTADDVVVTVTANNANFIGADGEKVAYPEIKCIGIEKKVDETTAAPVEETTAAPEAPSTPDETTAAPEATTDAGKTEGPATGDTGVLAIAAGVVALAGAAFVVSKKRK